MRFHILTVKIVINRNETITNTIPVIDSLKLITTKLDNSTIGIFEINTVNMYAEYLNPIVADKNKSHP